jgi:predicted component of type VI protein secretion system
MIEINERKEVLEKLTQKEVLKLNYNNFNERMREVKEDYLYKNAKTIINSKDYWVYQN